MFSKKRFILGALCIFLLGSAFHYLYDLLGGSILAAPFFAVNESIWEHMKLLSTAAFVWMAADFFLSEKYLRPRFCAARAVALPAALLSIPLLYYFIKGAFGIENVVVDISLFLVASILYQYIALRLEGRSAWFLKHNKASILTLCFIFLLFAIFTFLPPHLPLFADPPTGTYGLGLG